MSGASQQPQLRIHATTSTSTSFNVTAEQDPTALFEQMAQLFQLTPLPKRRPSMMSPSVVAIDALLDDIGDPQRLLHEMVVAAQAPQVIASPEQAQDEQVQPQAKKKQRTTRTGKTVASALNDDKDQPLQAAKKVRAPRKKTASSTAPTVLARLRKARGGSASADIKVVEQQQAAATAAAASAHLGSDSDELSMNSCSPSNNSKSNGTLNAMHIDSREGMVNVSRARQKEETAHLRVKVHELQAQLLKLGNRSKVSACRVATTSTSANNSNNNKQQVKSVTQVKAGRLGSLRAPIWERIANSAKDRKRRSEMENLRLRETVETQAKLSKSLGKILMKRANLAVLDMPSPPPPPASCLANLRTSGSVTEDAVSAIAASQEGNGDDDARVFDELASQLDRQYASLDDVHHETGLNQRTAEWQRCEVVESNNSASGLLLVDCCDIKLYPFSMDAVHQATWRCATVTAIKDVNYVSEVVLQTESTAHMTTTITIKKPNIPELVLSVKSVIKRITEPHRRVFLLNSVMSMNCRPIQLGAGWVPSPASVEIRDQGWATIESISDDERWPGSILRVCMRARPVDSQQMKDSGLADLVEGEVKALETLALSNLLVDTRNQVMRARQQAVENFLLEAEIARRS